MPACSVSSAEDPEKLLDQVVTEMQEDLIKMRQAAAQVIVVMVPTVWGFHCLCLFRHMVQQRTVGNAIKCILVTMHHLLCTAHPPTLHIDEGRYAFTLSSSCRHRSWHLKSSWKQSTSRHRSQQMIGCDEQSWLFRSQRMSWQRRHSSEENRIRCGGHSVLFSVSFHMPLYRTVPYLFV